MSNFHVYAPGAGTPAIPDVRRITLTDIAGSLRNGLDDFLHKPSHYAFLVMIYPLIGLVLVAWTSGANALPLVYPLVAGFAFLGPFAAIGLYEISRRREKGLDAGLGAALELRRSPALPSIAAVGFFLMLVFVAWLLVAQAIHTAIMGPAAPTAIGPFLERVLGTPEGWRLILFGNAVGLVFAAVVLSTTVVAFPMLLDRDCGAFVAMRTSIRAVARNPLVMAVWGVVVAVLLAVAMVPLFAGLIVVLPILGHATWHLYRKVVAE